MSREMDVEIATKVFGIALSEGTECGCCGGQGQYSRCGTGREGRRTRPTMQVCPNCRGDKRLGVVRPLPYSTSTVHAWCVVENMSKRYACVRIQRTRVDPPSEFARDVWTCCLEKKPWSVRGSLDDKAIFEEAETMPLAVCKAALCAVGGR